MGLQENPPADRDPANRILVIGTLPALGSQVASLLPRASFTPVAATDWETRRFMNDRLPAEVARAARSERELAIAIVDLDEFKPINDALGHASGDRALRAFGRALGTGLRSYDLVCRFGGDEFVVLFPDCDAGGARTALSQFRSRRGWALAGVPVVTFSAGIAEFPRDGRVLEELFEAADENLRRAKKSGGDRIFRAASGLRTRRLRAIAPQ